MPLKIIRHDITLLRCDAIVNPSNPDLFPGGGTDAAIHGAAGPELLKSCQALGGCPLGEARITPGFNLFAKYVIHTAGPTWNGGADGERAILRSCYRECLMLAVKNGCNSIAFPLISAGLYGYPKTKVLREALDVIGEFLVDYELDVFLVVFDKKSYEISTSLFCDVTAYIDNHYVKEHSDGFYDSIDLDGATPFAASRRAMRSMAPPAIPVTDEEGCSLCECEDLQASLSLSDMLSELDRGFAETLFYFIDKKGLTDVEAYKKSNVGKKTFSKIKCNRSYRPSKITAISFAVGLHLDIKETETLLRSSGFCLSRSNKFDVIIEYFIVSGAYKTVFDVNEVLYQFDQPLLGV